MNSPVRRRHGPPISRRVVGLLAVLAGVALPAACVDGEAGPEEEPAVDEVVEATGSTYELDCRRLDYPCTWGEVDTETLRRTDELGSGALDVLEQTGELVDVAEWLQAEAGVAEVQVGPLAVRFRPEGGRPAWVFAPEDTANLLMGGGSGRVHATHAAPASRRIRRDAAGGETHLVPSPHQNTEDRNGVAARNGEVGRGKRALILSPYEFQAVHGQYLADVLTFSRDYSRKGGSVTYHANLREGRENPNPRPEEVRLEHFTGWDDYNFVYVSTHGASVCGELDTLSTPVAERTRSDPCHTTLRVGQIVEGATNTAEFYDAIPGVDIRYHRAFRTLHPGLSATERAECRVLVDGLELEEPLTRLGKPCRQPREAPWGEVLVTTDFFRAEYPGGLMNVLVFLAACKSLHAGDLADVFTNADANANVAVLGYDEIVSAKRAVPIGRAAVDYVDEGLDSRALKDSLQARFPEDPLVGVVFGEDSDAAVPARIVEAASNPTHARDVVELVDPLTGEELEDGAGIIALGSPNDGRPDRIRVGMQVLGIDDETDIDAIRVHLEVDGRETEPFALTRWVRPHVMRVEEEEVDLGFDLGTKETVDLEIHAELEGGGESRWAYDSLKLASWTMDLAAPSVSGRYAGFQGFFQDEEGEAQLSLCSNEGPHVWIIADVEGFAGPGQYTVTNPNPSASVAVGPIDFRTGDAAAMEAMNDFTSGNGTSVLHEPGGASFMLPPPATLQVTQATDEYVEGTLRGRFFQQRPPDYRYEEASVSISFRVRRMNPMESFFSIVSRPEEGLCVAMPF